MRLFWNSNKINKICKKKFTWKTKTEECYQYLDQFWSSTISSYGLLPETGSWCSSSMNGYNKYSGITQSTATWHTLKTTQTKKKKKKKKKKKRKNPNKFHWMLMYLKKEPENKSPQSKLLQFGNHTQERKPSKAIYLLTIINHHWIESFQWIHRII